MSSPDLSSLAGSLGRPESLITDLTGWEDYFHDATEESAEPLALILAESTEDVAATMRFAHDRHLPVVPRGAGTGLSGGCVPCPGSLLLSVERMRRLEIEPQAQRAVCGPGVITKNLLDAAAEHGLTYPPDPASYEECSLGGNVAENAGGLRCKRFGVTRDYVLGLKAVLADGLVLDTGLFCRNRGFNLGDLLIASEGTLAVVTEIAVRLVPIPDPGTTILVAFGDAGDAARAVAEITAAGVIPTIMEYLDGDAAACSNQYESTEGLDRAAAILLLETAGDKDRQQRTMIESICRACRCSYLRQAEDAAAASELWRVRRNLSKAIRAAARFRYNEDVAVPVSQFMTLIAFVDELNHSGPLRVNAFGHAGDGNLHVSFLSMTGDDSELRLIHDYVERLYRRTLELGGTLTGEHGIGLHKGPYLGWEFDAPTLTHMRLVKEAFDPGRRLNPDKVFADGR